MKNMKIENNIFRYKFECIKIFNLNKSGNIYLVSDYNEIMGNNVHNYIILQILNLIKILILNLNIASNI